MNSCPPSLLTRFTNLARLVAWPAEAPHRRCGLPTMVIAMACVCGPVAPPALAQPAQAVASSPAASGLPSIAALAPRILPAIVEITVTARRTDDDRESCRIDGPRWPAIAGLSDEILPLASIGHGRDRAARGSGFIVDPSGEIVTSYDLVSRARRVEILLSDGSVHAARVLGADAMTDIALLKIDTAAPLPSLAWGDSSGMRAGDWVIAPGNPFGLERSLRIGTVTAIDRELALGPYDYDDFLQIDAAINRGDAGAPVLDLQGRVVGVSARMYAPAGGSLGIGFALPAALVEPAIAELRGRGRVARSWLGVSVQETTAVMARAIGLAGPDGDIVNDVTANGPAARAGLRQGDVVLAINGHKAKPASELAQAVGRIPVGGIARLRIWRGGRQRTIAAVTAAMPSSGGRRAALARPEEEAGGLGLTFAPLSGRVRRRLGLAAGVKGVVVAAIARNSPLFPDRVAPCDVVESIDRQPVSTPRQALATLDRALRLDRSDRPVLLLINRVGAARFLAVSIPHKARSSVPATHDAGSAASRSVRHVIDPSRRA
jgi:serine protease Do